VKQNRYKGIVMPQKSGIILTGHPVHTIQRGNNRNTTFNSDGDSRYYLDTPTLASKESQYAIHAYVLMRNHVHMLITLSIKTGISCMMQSIGRCYNFIQTWRRQEKWHI